MANNKIQIKRTTVSGRVANTTDSANTTFIDKGELAFNLADRKLYSSDTSNAIFEVGSNLTNLAVSSSITLDNNGSLRFKTISGSPVYFIQQSDDNFVFYTTNTVGSPRAIYSIFANSATSNLNFSVRTWLGGGLQIPTGTTLLDSTGSQGTSGQVLTSNGSSNVYWSSPGVASVNTAAQWNWTNTHTFNANVSFKDDISLENANAIYFNSISDANWRMGRATGAFTKWFYTGNTIDIVIANTAGEGFAIGLNAVNTYFETGYRGTFVANSITIGSGASNTIISNNSITTSSISTTTINASGNATADIIAASNNGNGTNFKVGDDAWIGDINVADTLRIMGQQSNNNAYIVFGVGDANTLGRSGTGPLTYTGTFTANIVNAASLTVGATVVANSTGVYATQLGGQSVTNLVSNSALQGYGYLSNAAAVTTFVSNASLQGYAYLSNAAAVTTYLSNAAAVTTFVSNSALQGYAYLSNAAAQTTYLSNAAAVVTYISNAAAQTTFLSNAAARATYLSNAAAVTTYLSNAAAVTTFVSNSALVGLNYINATSAVSNSALIGYNYINATTAATTYLSNAAAQTTYLSNAAAVVTYLSNAAAVTTFVSNSALTGYNYINATSAVSNSALQTYNYINATTAATTYLSNAAAVTTFVSNSALQGYGYLSNAAAVVTFVSNSALQGYGYLSNAAAQTTYLSNAAAVTTFASNASLQGYGYLSNAAAIVTFVSNSALQGYGYLSNAAAVTTFVSNAAYISGSPTFIGQQTFNGVTTFNANATFNAADHIILSSTSGISANSTFGSAGQVLTTTGSAVYWSSAGVNTAAQYSWTNTHTFNSTVTFNANAIFANTARITGDFTNATVNNRNMFVTSTLNGATGVYALPNGTSGAASWQAANSSDPTNASKILIATNGSTDVQLVSGINGTGTYLPLTFYNNGSEQMRLAVNGNFGIGNTAPNEKVVINGTANATTVSTNTAIVAYLKDPQGRTLTIANSTGGIVWGT